MFDKKQNIFKSTQKFNILELSKKKTTKQLIIHYKIKIFTSSFFVHL